VSFRRLSAFAVLSLVLALGPASMAGAATKTVSIGDNFYSPASVTISVGDTVTWTNNGAAPHTVTADNGSFDSSPGCPANVDACMQPGDTYSHTFSAAGTFGYSCKVHGQSMSGTVVVQGGGGGGTEPGPSGTLPNTGAGGGTFLALLIGAGLLVAGGATLLAARRRRA
jgi:LPXTG-motif cell wall-anchored protein